MSKNITEELMHALESGNPLPDYEEMEFTAPGEIIDRLARRIDNMPDHEKIEKNIEKERNLARKKGIPFAETAIRSRLEKTCFISRNKFATMANISASHLTQFLNGPSEGKKAKGISRDRLLSIFITLGMGVPEANDFLKKFDGIDTLHASIRRDYIIMMGMEQHLSLDEIDQLLQDYQLEGFENFK